MRSEPGFDLKKQNIISALLLCGGRWCRPTAGPRLALIAGYLLLALVTGACTHASPTAPAALSPTPRPFLWTTKQGQVSNQLFGTMHAGVPVAKVLAGPVEEALAKARCLVMESDPHSIDPSRMRQLATLPPGSRLQDLLSAAAWQSLVEVLSDYPEATLQHLQPWLAAVLALKSQVKSEGAAMDFTLLERARQRGLNISFLESPEEAISALAKAIDAEDLAELLQGRDKVLAETEALAQAYLAGDASRLQGLLAVAGPASREKTKIQHKLDLLLARRNRAWMPQLLRKLAGGHCLVAVGVGHYLGPDGLLQMLDQSGWHSARLGGDP